MTIWEQPIVNVAYFVSGGGSNFENLEKYLRQEPGRVRGKLVISNRAGTGAQSRATTLGLPFLILKPDLFNSPQAYEDQLNSLLHDNDIHLICLAGYLKKLPDSIVHRWENRILNIHPSLLPAFGGPGMYGHHVHEAVLKRGCKLTGATVHLVTSDYDAGPIIAQEAVPVLQDDTPDSLQKRVLTMEHQLYPQAVDLITSTPWTIENNQFKIRNQHENH